MLFDHFGLEPSQAVHALDADDLALRFRTQVLRDVPQFAEEGSWSRLGSKRENKVPKQRPMPSANTAILTCPYADCFVSFARPTELK